MFGVREALSCCSAQIMFVTCPVFHFEDAHSVLCFLYVTLR